MRDGPIIEIETVSAVDTFDNVTEEEIIRLWRSFRYSGLSWEEAWHAIVTGIALDAAFDRTRSLERIEH